MSKRNVLGRGLSALIQSAPKRDDGYMRCPVDEIVPNKFQPRRAFNDVKLVELADSIKENGIIEPLVARRGADGGYELIAGERRWRAAKVAGLREVPLVVLDVTDKESLEFAIIENIQRENLNAIEEAEAYQRLMESFSLTQEGVAQKVGKERATVANYLRLLQLPAEVKEEIVGGTISMGHARAILSLDNHAKQRDICKQVVQKGLSVRETEKLVKGYGRIQKKAAPKATYLAPLEDEMRRLFGTKVAVKEKRGRGKLEIEFYSVEELDRIIDLLRSITASC
ncbi:MAG: ParB/RepB/Spo0J family partition protein [Thermodesulfobacteriota bacterium]